MTSVRPVAVAPSDGTPRTRQSRGSGDLFAGLLEVAGGGDTSAPARRADQRSSSPQHAYRDTGCVVRAGRAEDTPEHGPVENRTGAVEPHERTDEDSVTRPEDPSDGDASTDAPDGSTEPRPDVPTTAAPTPPVLDVEAALNAGMVAARNALPADGWGATPTGGTPEQKPPLLPGAAGRPVVVPVGGVVVIGASSGPAAVSTEAAKTVPGGRRTTKSEQPTATDPAPAGPTDASTEPARVEPTGTDTSAHAVAEPTDNAAAGREDTAPAPGGAPAAGTAGPGAHDGAGHQDGSHDRSHDRSHERSQDSTADRTAASAAPSGVGAATESLAARSADGPPSAQPAAPAAGSAPAPSSGPGSPAGPTALAAGTGSPGTASAGTHTGSASSVTGQVIPEVARLITRGDGTQRVTVKLAPEALGEVRIVLTVRRGEVHVRMTGSEAAQQALLQGQSDLHRLLAGTGAASSSVQVGDQAATFGNAPENGAGSRDDGGLGHGADGASGQPGSDVRRDTSDRQQGGDPAGRDVRGSGPTRDPATRHHAGRAASPSPTRAQSSRLDVSV